MSQAFLEQAITQLRGQMHQAMVREQRHSLTQLQSTPANSQSYTILGKPGLHLKEGVGALKVVHLSAVEQQARQVVVKMCQHIAQVLIEHKRTGITIGMSGGADSSLCLVLGALLARYYGFKLQVVHCIHGLDPDDAIWLEHNRNLCQQLHGILEQSLVEKKELAQHAKDLGRHGGDVEAIELKTPVLNIVYGQGRSPEDASRQERYRALLELTRDGDALVLGHQADDQIEGMLLSLKRGAGLKGLSGMQEVTCDCRGFLLRPLLALHKVEVEQILNSLGVAYVYDLSNSYRKFERNFIRLEVLPLLRSRFAGVDRAILRTQQLCSIEHDLAKRYVQEQLKGHVHYDEHYDQYVFTSEGLELGDRNLMAMLLREFFKKAVGSYLDFNLVEQALNLLQLPHDRNGQVVLGQGLVASCYKSDLYVYRERTSIEGSYSLSLGESLELGGIEYRLIEWQQKESSFNLVGDSVELCFSPRMATVLRAVGRRHSRELKKLVNEYGAMPWVRKWIPLVRVGGENVAYGDLFVCEEGQKEANGLEPRWVKLQVVIKGGQKRIRFEH